LRIDQVVDVVVVAVVVVAVVALVQLPWLVVCPGRIVVLVILQYIQRHFLTGNAHAVYEGAAGIVLFQSVRLEEVCQLRL
jgi:hypothetical protein